jgi:uncharacterized protein (TIGR03067 family)
MRRLIGILGVLAAPVLLNAGTEDDMRSELKRLEGKWTTVGMEAGGKSFPKEQVLDFTIVVGADGKSTGRMPQEEFRFTMTVDPKKSPKTIENLHESGTQKGHKQYGIYKLDGDKFTVCMTRPGAAETDRPKDFDSKNAATVVFVFERVKEEKGP